MRWDLLTPHHLKCHTGVKIMLIEFWKVVPSEQLVRESNLIYMLIRVEKWYLLMNRMPALVWLGMSVKVFITPADR